MGLVCFVTNNKHRSRINHDESLMVGGIFGIISLSIELRWCHLFLYLNRIIVD